MDRMTGGPSVGLGAVGRFGENAVERGEGAQRLAPEPLVVGVRKELPGCLGRDPRAMPQFGFQLALGPTGISRKGADERAGVLRVADGVRGGKTGRKPKPLFRSPPKGRKGEVLVRDGPTHMHRNAGERRELFLAEKIADPVLGRLVENQSVAAILRVVVGNKNDGVAKGPFAERGVRQKNLALQANGGFL